MDNNNRITFVMIMFILIFVISVVSILHGSDKQDNQICGTITNKFNQSAIAYNIMYKMDMEYTEYIFVLDNTTSVTVTHDDYIEYEVGDYYTYKRVL